MGVTGGVKCAKFFLFTLNSIFFLAGAILLGIGLWLKFDSRINSYFQHSQTTPLYTNLGLAVVQQTVWVVFVAFGAFIFVGGFCGCCGAIKESRCLLGFYIAFIVVIIAGEVGGILYALITFRNGSKTIEEEMLNDLKTQYKSNSSLINDHLMTQLKCCGWNGHHDFNFTSTLPGPCCTNSSHNLNANVTCSASMAPNVYGGCKSLILDVFEYAGKIFMGVGISVALLEIIVLVSAIALCRAIWAHPNGHVHTSPP